MANTVIAQEIFSAEVQRRLVSDDSFLRSMRNANAYLSPSGKTAHIPNAATASTITIDGSINAAGESVVDYTHTDVELTLSVARVAPIRGLNFEEATNNYDAFMAQAGVNIGALAERAADHIIYKIVADVDKTNYKVATTGTAGTGNGPAASNRKALTLANVRSAQKLMNKSNVPKTGRYMLLNTEMINELMADTTVASMLTNTEIGVQKLIQGALGMLCGFVILERAWTGAVNSSDVAQLVNTSEVNTWNYVGLAWQTDMVLYANSPVKTFANTGSAQHYGDVISAEVNVGAIIPRTSKVGVVAIIQAS